MPNEVILTCAVTGGHNNQAKHPDYPITPEQIANNCIDAAKAGAAGDNGHFVRLTLQIPVSPDESNLRVIGL